MSVVTAPSAYTFQTGLHDSGRINQRGLSREPCSPKPTERRNTMKTILEKIDGTPADEERILHAGRILRAGGLVAFPTETVYGLGGDALNPDSSRKIYEAKGRPSDNPLIVHVCRWEDVSYIAEDPTGRGKLLADAFWPGPLTMILPKKDTVPMETTGGLDTVAVRLPSHPAARRLIRAAGGYVAAPSANTSGKPSPTTAQYVAEDMDGRIEMILDGGTVGIGLESTIVDLTGKRPVILRPGYVTQRMLEEVLEGVELDRTILEGNAVGRPKAPGMKYRHYAPKGDLAIVEGPVDTVLSYINGQCALCAEKGEKTGVIGTDETAGRYRADSVKSVGSRADEEAIAHSLYRILREFDDEGVQVMYSEAFSSDGMGQAIMNRLLKAAGHRVIRLDEDGARRMEEKMKIALGSDHGGYELKKEVIRWLEEHGYECVDYGCNSTASCDYPDFGRAAAEAVASGACEKGIVICTTGIGISIVANKVKGIRCALCADTVTARLTREHNDANMLAMGAGIVGRNLALGIVEAFFGTEFSGEEKHARRIGKIEA